MGGEGGKGQLEKLHMNNTGGLAQEETVYVLR